MFIESILVSFDNDENYVKLHARDMCIVIDIDLMVMVGYNQVSVVRGHHCTAYIKVVWTTDQLYPIQERRRGLEWIVGEFSIGSKIPRSSYENLRG